MLNTANLEQFPEYLLTHFHTHTHIYCLRGRVKFNFNGLPYQGKTGVFVFFLVDSDVSELSFSKDFKGLVLFVDKDFLVDNFPSQNRSIDALLYSKENPVLHPENKNDKDKILKNFRELDERFQETSHQYYEEVLNLQMQLYLWEMWHIFYYQQRNRPRSLQSGTLYDRFLQLVSQHCMKEREVRFYNEQLNITAKHLNHICKANTDITASQWIQRYTKERIKILLSDKNLNISEIANEMAFSSRSFFTRYVKKALGVSPSEYRQRLHQ